MWWKQNNHHMLFPKAGYINISKQDFNLQLVNHTLQPQQTPYFSPMKSPTKSPTGSASTVTHGAHVSSASCVSLQTSRKVPKETHLLLMVSKMNAIMMFSIMVSQPLLRLKASSIYVTLKTNPKHQITMRKICSKNNKTLFIQFFSRPSLQTMAKHLSENMKLTGMPSPFLPSSIPKLHPHHTNSELC